MFLVVYYFLFVTCFLLLVAYFLWPASCGLLLWVLLSLSTYLYNSVYLRLGVFISGSRLLLTLTAHQPSAHRYECLLKWSFFSLVLRLTHRFNQFLKGCVGFCTTEWPTLTPITPLTRSFDHPNGHWFLVFSHRLLPSISLKPRFYPLYL